MAFAARTLVSTPAGWRPIESVAAGSFVHTAGGLGQVLATLARPADDLLTLEFADATTLTCTADAPTFTESGWRPAGALVPGSLALGLESLPVLWQDLSALDETESGRKLGRPAGGGLEGADVLLLPLRQPGPWPHASGEVRRENQRRPAGPRMPPADAGRQRPADPPAAGETAGGPGLRVGRGLRGAGSGCVNGECGHSPSGSQPATRAIYRGRPSGTSWIDNWPS